MLRSFLYAICDCIGCSRSKLVVFASVKEDGRLLHGLCQTSKSWKAMPRSISKATIFPVPPCNDRGRGNSDRTSLSSLCTPEHLERQSLTGRFEGRRFEGPTVF